MNPLGIFHTACSLIALGTGLVVVLNPKGTQRHRVIGYMYVAAMLALNISALMIYRVFGRFGPLHIFAIISLLSVIAGLVPAIRKQAGWLNRHYTSMSWSYLGLLAAAAAETLTRLPIFDRSWAGFGISVALATVTVTGIGAWIIQRKRASVMAAVGRRQSSRR